MDLDTIKLRLKKKGRRWYWRLTDFFDSLLEESRTGSLTRDGEREAGRKAKKEFKRKLVEVDERRELLRIKAKKFPPNWKRLVSEHDKLGKSKVHLKPKG